MSKNEATTTKVSRIKTTKKNWYTIQAPAEFGKRELGESYLVSPETAQGRTVSINLRELTGNSRDQNVYLTFRMGAGKGHILPTDVIGYSLTATSVKRLVRGNTDRLDDYFMFTSKDGKKVVVKTLIITLHKVQRSVSAHLRKDLGEFLRAEIESNDFTSFMVNLAGNKVLAPLKKNLHKIYPLKEAAIRVLKLQEEMVDGAGANSPSDRKATALEPVDDSKTVSPSPPVPPLVAEPEENLLLPETA